MSFDLSRISRLRKVLPVPLPQTRQYKIPFTVENFSGISVSSNLTDHRRSDIHSFRETEWMILLGKVLQNGDQVTALSFYVACRMPAGSCWFCDADLEFRLVSQDSCCKAGEGCNDITWRVRQTFRGDATGAFQLAGFDAFDDFEVIRDPANGFSADDSIYAEVIVRDMQYFTVTDRFPEPQSFSMETLVSEAIPCLLNNRFYSDVEFDVNGFKFHAHRIFLALRSPAMDVMFSSRLKDDPTPSITLYKQDPAAFYSLLSLIYRNRLILTDRNILDIYKCAQYFGLPEVQRACLSLIMPENVIEWSKVAIREDADLMYRTCVTVCAAGMERLVQREDWLSAPKRLVKRLSVEDELNISEKGLFEAIVRWAEAQTGPPLIEIAADLIYNIRFTTMGVEVFKEVTDQAKILINSQDFTTICLYFITGEIPAKFNHIPRKRVVL